MAVSLNTVTRASLATSGSTATIVSSIGNLIVVSCALSVVSQQQTISSITDNKSNTYVLAAGSLQTGELNVTPGDAEIWYAANAATGVTTLTVNFTGAQTFLIAVYDCLGADPALPLGYCNMYNDNYTSLGSSAPFGPSMGYSNGGTIFIAVLSPTTGLANVTAINSPFTFDGSGANNAGFAHYVNSSSGYVCPTWTLASPQSWTSVGCVFVSQVQSTFTQVRLDYGGMAAAGTAVSSNGITTAPNDLVVLIGQTDTGKAVTPFTDNYNNNWTFVAGMNPFDPGSGYEIAVAWGILSNGGTKHRFTFNHASASGPSISVFIVKPTTGTPVLNTTAKVSTASGGPNYTNVSITPSVADLLIAYLAINGANQTSFAAGASWLLGQFQLDNTNLDSSALEFQLAAAGGSTSDNFTGTTSAVPAREIILSFTSSLGGPDGSGMCSDAQYHWLGGDDN